MLTASTAGSKLYNKWAFLALDISADTMWLVNSSLLGVLASYLANRYYYYYYYYNNKNKRSLKKRTVTDSEYHGALVGSSGIAAIELCVSNHTPEGLIGD